MTRRGIFGVAAALLTPLHLHDFKEGPFFVMASVTYEEPRFYPPQGMVPLLSCTCGEVRLPAGLASKTGLHYLNEVKQ